MADIDSETFAGEITSPGGFVFGVQGWTWGEQRPTSITFFLDGTVKVCDQYGRPCKGTLTPDGKPILFSKCSHAQVIEALVQERIDWTALNCAGWPQLPYAKLREIEHLPWFQRLLQASMTADTHGTYLDELRKIKNPEMRKDAIRFWRDVEAEKTKELQEATEE